MVRIETALSALATPKNSKTFQKPSQEPAVARDLTPADPSTVLELLEAFRRSKIMFTGVSLGVFDTLKSGPIDADSLAQRLECDPAATQRLLDSLVGLGLLARDGDTFANTPAANEYLTSDSPSRMTGYINYSNRVMWPMWGNLEGAIREGTHRWQQTYGWDGPIFSSFFKDDASMREFLMGMHGFGMLTSPRIVDAIDLSRFKHLVDLGGATGHLAIAACERYSALCATVFDLPVAVPLAREITSASSVHDRINVVGGDFFVDDLPPAGQRLARNRYFAHIQKHEQWKKGIQAYLASIHFADAMLGRVLDALEKSPQRDNTIVVLWSDHGWHLGEKEHWQKFTGWRVCARVPLMIRVPKGAPGLQEGTTPGSVCDRPVSLVDLFGTLTDLCGLPPKADIDSRSFAPLLRNPQADWPHAALTHLDQPENYAISTERWRYIHYISDEEELYDLETDPHEWTNLATKPEHAAKLAEMRLLKPKNIAPVHKTKP